MTLPTIQTLLDQATTSLAAITDQPQLDAEVLLACALKKPRSYLYAWPDKGVSNDKAQLFSTFLIRRLNREPVAYITGKKEFWSLNLTVSHDTLIPRPETEVLVNLVLKTFSAEKAQVIADLGTGSGAIAIALAKECPRWELHAVDAHEAALAIARNNAQQFAQKNIYFYLGNWCTPLPRRDFDVIISNPPYIGEVEWGHYAQDLAFEPRLALVSGTNGLDAILEICASAKDFLKPGGFLFIEHGFWQGVCVREIFVKNGYDSVHSVNDLAGQERVTAGRYLKQ